MVGVKSSTNREALVSSGRLNPRAAKGSLLENFPVKHAVQRATASHDQVVRGSLSVQFVEDMKPDLLKPLLHGEGNVHVPLHDLSMRLACGAELLRHKVREVRSKAHSSVGQNLHSLVAPQRL